MKAAAEVEGVMLAWHKIVHFGPQVIDKPAYNSVQFTHLLCFWRWGESSEAFNGGPPDLGTTLPDVMARGEKPWGLRNSARCMGSNATLEVLKWASRRLDVDTVVDPFCGAGTVLAIGNAIGLKAVGVDLSARRVKQARSLDGEALLAGRESSRGRDEALTGEAAP